MRISIIWVVLFFILFACQSNSGPEQSFDAEPIAKADSVAVASAKPTHPVVHAEAQNGPSKAEESSPQSSKTKRLVPFPKSVESAQRFMVGANLGDSLYFEIGTEIHIPPKTLLLANGKAASE